jgi:hypothetical protein
LIAVERQRKEGIAGKIKRAKSMPNGGSHWTDDRQKGRVWTDNPVDMTEHAGDKTTTQKLHLNQLLNIGQIVALANEEISMIAKQADKQKRTGIAALRKTRDKIVTSNGPEPDPLAVNHAKAENPCKSKFGEAEWHEKVKQSVAVKKHCCALDLAECMVAEGCKLFPDGRSWFCHDTLSLLTATETESKWKIMRFFTTGSFHSWA